VYEPFRRRFSVATIDSNWSVFSDRSRLIDTRSSKKDRHEPVYHLVKLEVEVDVHAQLKERLPFR